MKFQNLFFAAAIALVAGCFTIKETPYPETELSEVRGDTRVLLQGCEAYVTEYTPVYGTETVMMSSDGSRMGMGRRGRRGGGRAVWGTRTTETLLPIIRPTPVYFRQACARLEKAGMIVLTESSLFASNAPAYTVRINFEGPYSSPSDALRTFAIDVGSLFFALHDTVTFDAEVSIHDNATGKLVFRHAASQMYSCTGWSPLWIFGMMEYNKLDSAYIRDWCFSALVDRLTADVSAFMAEHVGKTNDSAVRK